MRSPDLAPHPRKRKGRTHPYRPTACLGIQLRLIFMNLPPCPASPTPLLLPHPFAPKGAKGSRRFECQEGSEPADPPLTIEPPLQDCGPQKFSDLTLPSQGPSGKKSCSHHCPPPSSAHPRGRGTGLRISGSSEQQCLLWIAGDKHFVTQAHHPRDHLSKPALYRRGGG